MIRIKLCRRIRRSNGSLTVEACLAFPVFLCFFLLLAFFIRTACIQIVLNHAVKETAKQLATSAYPLALLNEMEDELLGDNDGAVIPTFADEAQSIKGYIAQGRQDILSKLLSGGLEKGDINHIISSIAEQIREDYVKGLGAYLEGEFGENYFELKSHAKYAAADWLMKGFCEGSAVDTDKLSYRMVVLPSGNVEFEIREKEEVYRQLCAELGYSPGQDDVVVSADYPIKIPLPFFGKHELVLRHVAVERAWLHGSNGVYTITEEQQEEGTKEQGESEDDPLDPNKKKERVYITRTGIKYHKKSCRHLAKSSKVIQLPEAQKRGYTPCKRCYK